jgi:hypothetical protein
LNKRSAKTFQCNRTRLLRRQRPNTDHLRLPRGPTTGRQTSLVRTTWLATPARHSRGRRRAENNQAANQIGVAARRWVSKEKKNQGAGGCDRWGKRRGGAAATDPSVAARHGTRGHRGTGSARCGAASSAAAPRLRDKPLGKQNHRSARAAAVVPPPSPAGHFTARPTPAAHHRTASASLL